MFKNQEKKPVRKGKHRADKSGRSKVRQAVFIFKQSEDAVLIECYDWHKDMPYQSNFKVILSSKELDDWLVAKN